MREDGVVVGLDDGADCGLDKSLGGGGIDFELAAGREGAVSDLGDSSAKEGAVAAFDESSEKEGTAIEGAAGFA